MDNKVLYQAELYNKKRKRHKTWAKILIVLSTIVVFATTYWLILPAITMEKQPACGIEEHQHSEECYGLSSVEQTSTELICTPECHAHTADCIGDNGSFVCGYANRLIHTHSDICYYNDTLICSLPEVEEHLHSNDCYANGNLVCGKEQIAIHTHEDSCYDENGKHTCAIFAAEEHVHIADCLRISSRTKYKKT